jgi:hypothetical protein
VHDHEIRRPTLIFVAYNHSTALCMTIAALQTGKRVTFDSKKRTLSLPDAV